jgi:hypothetical protein
VIGSRALHGALKEAALVAASVFAQCGNVNSAARSGGG